MKIFIEYFKYEFLELFKACILLLCIVSSSGCNNNKSEYIPIQPIAVHSNGMEYIGMETCTQCHLDIVESHKNTAHWLTSAIATEENIKGSFLEGENSFDLNHEAAFMMIKNDSGFFQRLYLKDNNQILYDAQMQMVIGSGTKGQSYLVWDWDALYQLQASYFTPTDSWINSPGFPPNPVQVRPVPGRCLECHTTFATRTSPVYDNRFDKKTMIMGIDCQRCHGAVKEHVLHHRKNPNDSVAKLVMSYKDLDRTQRLDACALCHSGLRENQMKNNFAFMPGDRLDKFSLPDYDASNLNELDVHGNQFGLLQASECFKKSTKMDCMTCHNPHKNDRGNSNLFNETCMKCHKKPKLHKRVGHELDSEFANCIACHMPFVDSNVMKIQVSMDSLVSVKIRTHLIGVYNQKQ